MTIKIEKPPKTAPSESRPVTRPLGSPKSTASPGLLESTLEANGTRSQTLGGSKAAVSEYIPALGDEPELKKAGSTTSLGEALDPAVLLEEMELMWKKLLAKRQGASANMDALFKARQLKDEVDEAAKQATDSQQKKALAASKVAGRIHLIEDACHTLEKKAVKNIGKGALWRRGDLAVRAGGNGLCEITATNMKSEMDVHMCISGADLTLDRGMLVPMARKEMEDLRKLLSEMEAAKAEQIRLQEAVTQSCDQLRQKHEKLVEQIELELEELEKNPEFAPAGTQPENMELVIGWNGQQHRPSQSEAPSFPQMAGLISAAEMMLKAQAEQKAAEKASKPRTNEASDWVEETTEEGETIFRNQKTNETATELPAPEAAAPMGHAASPTVPAGAIPPWAKAPPKPQGGLWREPGLSMPKSKAPPPMPKAPAALERLQKLKEDAAASLQETQGLSKSLGPRAKVPGPPAPGSSLGPAAAAAAKAAATAKAAAAAAAGPAAEATTETPAAEQPTSEAAKEVAPTTYWTEVQTEEGDTYYHNEATDETAWELPPGGVIKKPDDDPAADAEQPAEYGTPFTAQAPVSYWSPVTADDGQTYYYNLETGEAAWDVPPGGQVYSDQGPAEAPAGGQMFGAWMQCQTPEGEVYYYNQQTGETSWDLPAAQVQQPQQAQQAQQAYNPFAQAEEAARLQRQQYEDALRSMQQAEEQARQQREQWDQIYAQHFAWYQQQQQQQAQAAAAAQQGAAPRTATAAEGAAAGLVPPSIHATMEEQIAFAMKCSVVQEMEEMMKNGASVADRKKALKAWQIKWHPDKNPDQVEVAKTLFQFLAEKRQWFCQDPSAEGNWEDIPVDAVD